jgi:hypothetical protein
MSRADRQRWTNLALLALAIGLVIAVVATRGKVTTTERETRAFNVLAAWREDEVTRITYDRGSEHFQLERVPEADRENVEWRLTKPYLEDAEPFATEKLLGTLQYAASIRRIKPDQVDRAAFGLDAPRMVLELQMGEIVYRLRLGKEAASPPGSAYLEITGEGAPNKGIVLIGQSLVEELTLSADTFRGRYIVPYLSPALARFTVDGSGGRRAFERAEWGGWRFEGMLGGVRAERQALDRLVLQFARTVADDLIDPAAAEAALSGAEKIVISQTPKDPKLPPGKVEVGGKCPGDPERLVALRLAPDRLAGCVTRTVWAGLTIPAEAIVDRSLFHMRRDEVESFEVRREGRTLRLERRDEGFVMREPREAEVDGAAGNARLEAILGATGRRLDSPDLAGLGLEPPVGQVVLRSAAAHDDDVRVETVRLGRPRTDGSVSVQREHDGVVLELVREAARALTPDASLVRSRTVFDYRLEDLRRVDVEGPVRQAFARDPKGTIVLESPRGYDVDAGLAVEVMDVLRTLTADRWVADEDDGTFGLDEPLLRVRFTTQKDEARPEEHAIAVGRPTPSGYFARVQGDAGVFVLPRRAFEVLTMLVLDRAVFMVDPTVVATVELTTADRRVVLERLGDQFIQAGGSELAPAAIQRIVDALSVMRAEAAIATGSARPEHGLGAPLLTVRAQREPGTGGSVAEISWSVGAGDTWRGVSVHYARARGVDAVFVLPRSQVRQILDAF